MTKFYIIQIYKITHKRQNFIFQIYFNKFVYYERQGINMELNKTLLKIRELLDERHWSLYRLAKNSEIPYSSLNSLFQNNNQPTLSTLEKMCNGLHISMSEFFIENTPYRDESPVLTEDEQELIHIFRTLEAKEKKKYMDVLRIFKNYN